MIAEFLDPDRWAWFAEPFEGMSWWQVLNEPFVGTAITSIVGGFLALRLQQATNDSRAAADAKIEEERSEAEVVASVVTTQAAPQRDDQPSALVDKKRFHDAAAEINRLKNYLDALAERVRDGRTRRKYSNMSRRDYRVIATAIHRDGGLSDVDAQKLVSAFDRWRSYKNGKSDVPVVFADELRRLAQHYKVTTAMPKPWRPVRDDAAIVPQSA